MFQNVRGLQETKLEELVSCMTSANLGAAILAETWRPRDPDPTSLISNRGTYLLLNGAAQEDGKPTRGGVGILLSKSWTKAWKKAGSQVIRHFGERIIALRLEFTMKNKTEKLFLVGAYAPTTGSTDHEHDSFIEQLGNCVASCQENEMLIIGADLNAAIGTAHGYKDRVCGPFGIKYTNRRGITTRSFLASRELCSTTSFFMKKNYATWRHFRSHKLYQNDFLIVRKRDLRKIRDAATRPSISLNSDHVPLRLRLRPQQSSCFKKARKKVNKSLDRRLLNGQERQNERNFFAASFIAAMNKENTEDLSANSKLNSALKSAADNLQATSVPESRVSPSWFKDQESSIRPLLNERNRLLHNYESKTRSKRLKIVKRKLRSVIREAKQLWYRGHAERTKDGPRNDPGYYWESVKELRIGHTRSQRETSHAFKKPDGSKCNSTTETVKVVAAAFEKNLNINRPFDESLLEHLEQKVLPDYIHLTLNATPTKEEIKTAALNAKKNKAAGDTQIPIEYFQALSENDEALDLILDVVLKSWNGEVYDEWTISKLKILPKKGDLSDPNNWRPIMLLEVLQKVMSSMFVQRFHTLLEFCGLQEQFGFQRNMGTTDASFVVRQAINLRHEAGKDTFALFIDLVKAFDSVPREGMIKILAKFGVPDKMLGWIRRIYDKVIVKVEIEDVFETFESCTGVKQGDNLSPTLFLFMMQAFVELVRNEHATGESWPQRLSYRTRKDGILTGRARQSGGSNSAKLHPPTSSASSPIEYADSIPTEAYSYEYFLKSCLLETADCQIKPSIIEFDLDASLYADDAAFLFDSRADLIKATRIINNLLQRLGMKMHIGSGNKASKTEAMFIPGHGRHYEEADTSRFFVEEDGFVDFTTSFSYLGSKITSDCKDDADIDHRIIQASKMFGSLRRILLCSKRITRTTKKAIYEAYVLPILLYGSEMWRLNSDSIVRLEKFHRKNVRDMAGVTTYTTWKNRISAFELEEQFRDSKSESTSLRGIKSYIAERALRWLGHVVRMESKKLPRRMLTAWVYKPKGENNGSKTGIKRTYGATIIHYHFAYLLKNPTINSDIREAITKETEHRSIQTGKPIRPSVLKQQTFYNNSYGKMKENWVRIAENRDIWRKEVVHKARYHYNYYFSKHGLPEPFQEVQVTQAETLLPQAETHHERALRILEKEENQRKKELECRSALKRKEREREKEIEQRKKEKERKQQEKRIEYRIRINERNARTNTCSLLSLT
jgi:hypothetical protein